MRVRFAPLALRFAERNVYSRAALGPLQLGVHTVEPLNR
jgi:hypothetical protein